MLNHFSAAADANKMPILERLRTLLAPDARVLEIGSGSGQHALEATLLLPGLRWQCTELSDLLPGLRDNLAGRGLAEPRALDVASDDWDAFERGAWEAVFTVNTFHIMPIESVRRCIECAATRLAPAGRLIVYGPMRYSGDFTTPSNARFDAWLKSVAPHRGIRDFEQLDAWAVGSRLQLAHDFAMPANNQLLVWDVPA